jgi:hypothetical protein
MGLQPFCRNLPRPYNYSLDELRSLRQEHLDPDGNVRWRNGNEGPQRWMTCTDSGGAHPITHPVALNPKASLHSTNVRYGERPENICSL